MVQRFAPAKALLAIAASLAALALSAPSALADTPQLTAKFNINLTFTMATGDGAPLGSPSPPGRIIPPGTYMLAVDDTAEIGYMSYVLQGPGVAVRTSNDEGAQDYETYGITLQPNSTYSFSDGLDPALAPLYFSTSGTGSGTTTTTPTTTSTPPVTSGQGSTNSGGPVGSKVPKTTQKPAATTSAVYRGILDALVSSTGKVTLTFDGKNVTSLRVGRYKVAVSDKSRRDGFTLQEAGLPATTVSNVAFVGKRSATLELAVGQWLYYPSIVGKKSYFLVTH